MEQIYINLKRNLVLDFFFISKNYCNLTICMLKFNVEEGIKLKNKENITKEKITGKRVFNEIVEWIVCFLAAYIIYLIVNYFFGTISCVRQTSMLPTAVEGQRVTVQRSKVFKKDLQYGDIIIFEFYDVNNNEKKLRIFSSRSLFLLILFFNTNQFF